MGGPLNWLPSQAALGLHQQAVEIHGVVLAFGGGGIKVVRMGVWKRQQMTVVRAEHTHSLHKLSDSIASEGSSSVFCFFNCSKYWAARDIFTWIHLKATVLSCLLLKKKIILSHLPALSGE